MDLCGVRKQWCCFCQIFEIVLILERKLVETCRATGKTQRKPYDEMEALKAEKRKLTAAMTRQGRAKL